MTKNWSPQLYTPIVELLLSYGADINARNKEGMSLIAMAQLEGLPVQPLLVAGAAWQAVGRGQANDAFLNCLPKESIEILSKIISDNHISEKTYHFAKVWSGCYCMDQDDTNIARAIRNNDLDILKMLIDAKGDLDFAMRCNRTPILIAIRENNLPALKMLVEASANPNFADPYGRIPAEALDEKKNSPEMIDYFMTVVKSKAPIESNSGLSH